MKALDAAHVGRFWSKVDKRSAVECWPWMACTSGDGYGAFSLYRKNVGAHRVAYALTNGDLGDKQVLHTCDVPLCCNPAHLFLGTVIENMQDAVSRHRIQHGQANHQAKLTNESVLEIRRRYQRGVSGCGYTSLAREFGVHPKTLKAAVTHNTWKLAELEAVKPTHRNGETMSVETHPVQTPNHREQAVVPKLVTMRAYEVYCHVYGAQEAMVVGGCRGGFSTGELIAFLYAHSFPREEWRVRVREAFDGMEHL